MTSFIMYKQCLRIIPYQELLGNYDARCDLPR